jgi:hypothetical protein
MKLDSAPSYPQPCNIEGMPTDYLVNQTPAGEFQVVRELEGGGQQENDFEILFEGTARRCVCFVADQVSASTSL